MTMRKPVKIVLIFISLLVPIYVLLVLSAVSYIHSLEEQATQPWIFHAFRHHRNRQETGDFHYDLHQPQAAGIHMNITDKLHIHFENIDRQGSQHVQ